MVHYLHTSKNCIESLNATLGGGEDKIASFQSDPAPLNLISDSGTNFQNPMYVSASSTNSWGAQNLAQNCPATNVVASTNVQGDGCKEAKVVSGRTRHLSHTYEPECKKNSDDDHEYETTIVDNVYHHHHNRTLITDKNHHHHHHHKTVVRDNHIHHNHLKNVIRDNHYHHHHRQKEHKSCRYEDPKCCVKTQHLTRRFECHDSDDDSDSDDSVSSLDSFLSDDDDYFSDGDTGRFLRIGRSRSHHKSRRRIRHSLSRHFSHRDHRSHHGHQHRRRRYSNCVETKYEEREQPNGAYHQNFQAVQFNGNNGFDGSEYRQISSRHHRPSHHRRHRDHFHHIEHFDRSERRTHRRHHSVSDLHHRRSRSISNLDDFELSRKFQDLLKKRDVRGKHPSLSQSTSFAKDKSSKKPCPYEALKKAQEAAYNQGYSYMCYPTPVAQPAAVDYCCYPSPPTPPPAPCYYPTAYPPQGGGCHQYGGGGGGGGGYRHQGYHHPGYY